MTNTDLSSRNYTGTLQNYKNTYINSVREFTLQEKHFLQHLVLRADKYLAAFKNINMIPWRFAKLCCLLEGGFPHTQLEFVFLEQSFFVHGNRTEQDMVAILIHEKLHVYQRLFPVETHMLISSWDYRPCGLLRNQHDARNNPDLNGILFCKEGDPSYMRYNNENPAHLNDSQVTGPDQFEHPFERMAYEISEHLVYGKDMLNIEKTLGWMRTYL
jgi:hypothetical protein